MTMCNEARVSADATVLIEEYVRLCVHRSYRDALAVRHQIDDLVGCFDGHVFFWPAEIHAVYQSAITQGGA